MGDWVYSPEVLARITKTPTTTYLIASIIPLVPGSGLYNTMSYAFKGIWEKAISTGVYTLALSAALAAGIMFASSIWRLFMSLYKRWKKQGKRNPLTEGLSDYK